jgi:Flp pilus assembly protein TadG
MFLKRDQKGQSLVEVALALPVLVLIVAGILDVGRAYFTFISLSDAAAEGAQYAAVYPTHTAQIKERAADSSNGLVMLDPSMVQVEYASLTAGSPITVSVEFDYQVITPIIVGLVPDGTLTMRARVSQAIINDEF